ncbi:choice-of-anchor D domain-containing protein [Limisalsivibrio acetivorans]|uniref:choice-of-anchor D domain-containing protein n=1 Tax=Limisalsivibrio acetivorans TaxID=1304888 RepID=UPI00138AEB5F|nr:choice-of-anchor D domain-containing protein [Limisalsivibrio acetivorans]
MFFILTACGGGGSGSSSGKDVSVSLSIGKLFPDKDIRDTRANVGGYEVEELILKVSAPEFEGVRLDLTQALNEGDQEVELTLTAGITYLFTIEAYGAENLLLCSGSESVFVAADSIVELTLLCALRIESELDEDDVEILMEFVQFENLQETKDVMKDTVDAVKAGLSLSDIKKAVAEAKLLAAQRYPRVADQAAYNRLVQSLIKLFRASPEALTAFSNFVDSLDNTAELEAAAEIIENIDEEGLKPEIFTEPQSSLSFNDTYAGENTQPSTVIVYNSGNYRLDVSGITLSDTVNFVLNPDGGVNPCGDGSFRLIPGESCTFSVTGSPQSVGSFSGSVSISSSDATNPNHTISLSMNGLQPPDSDIVTNPASIDFEAIYENTEAEETLTLRNDGAQPGTIENVITDTGVFSVSGWEGCGTLEPGAECSFDAVFAPESVGTYTGNLIITSRGLEVQTINVALRGVAEPTPLPEIVLEQSFYDFGQVKATLSDTAQFRLNNTGTLAGSVTDFISSNSEVFSVTDADNCTIIEPGDNCTFTAVFTPPAEGAYTGSIEIIAPLSTADNQTLSLAGEGLPEPAPIVSAEPMSVDFGHLFAHETATDNITLSNIGDALLKVDNITADSENFYADNICPEVLPGDNCTFPVAFAPEHAGNFTAILSISSNDPLNPVFGINLEGSAEASPYPDIFVDNRTLDFGTVRVTESSTLPLVIENVGKEELSIYGYQIIDNGSFSYDAECSLILPGESCTSHITFAPQEIGDKEGELIISSNDNSDGEYSISLFGYADEPPSGKLTLSPPEYDFGEAAVGSSVDHTFEIRNDGEAPFNVTSIAFTGDFSATHNCTNLPVSSACYAVVSFEPLTTGAKTGTMTVSTDLSDNGTAVSNLYGTATDQPASIFTVSPASMDFGTVGVETTHTQNATITNDGNDNLTVSFDNTDLTVFTPYDGGNCAEEIPPSGSCTFSVDFGSSTENTYSETLYIHTNDPDNAIFNYALSGATDNGLDPNISVSPVSYDFLSVKTGDTSGGSINVTNSGNDDLTVSSVSIAGSSDFTYSDNCDVLIPSESCVISVTYEPVGTTGARSATVSINSDDPDTPTSTVSLDGYAVEAGTFTEFVLGESKEINVLSKSGIAACNNGLAHAVYGGQGVMHAYFHSGTWYTQDIGATVPSGYYIGYTAIAVDSKCFPHVVYQVTNGSDGDVFYATNRTNSGLWEHHTVESDGDVDGASVTVQVDSSGGIHAAYQDATSGFLKYSFSTDSGASFSTEILDDNTDAGATGVDVQMDIDSSNVLHLTYSTGSQVKYLFGTSGSWSTGQVLTSTGTCPSIAVEGTDNMYVAWRDTVTDYIKFSSSATGWMNGDIDVSGSYGCPALAGGNLVHVAMSALDHSLITYKKYDSGTWGSDYNLSSAGPLFSYAGDVSGIVAASNIDDVYTLYIDKADLNSESYYSAAWQAEESVDKMHKYNEKTRVSVDVNDALDEVYVLASDQISPDNIRVMETNNVSGNEYTSEYLLHNSSSSELKSLAMKFDGTGIDACTVITDGSSASWLSYIENTGDKSMNFTSVDGFPYCDIASDGAAGSVLAYVGTGSVVSKAECSGINCNATGLALVAGANSQVSIVRGSTKNYIGYYNNSSTLSLADTVDSLTNVIASTSGDGIDNSMTVGSGGQIMAAFTNALNESLYFYECPVGGSCASTLLATPSTVITGPKIDRDGSDFYHVAFYDNGVLKYATNSDNFASAYVGTLSNKAVSNGYSMYDLAVNASSNTVHAAYQDGKSVIYSTDALVPVLGLSHITAAFGPVPQYSSSNPLEVTISNNGVNDMNVNISLEDSTEYGMETGYSSSACDTNSFTLKPQKSCTVKLRYNPSLAGGAHPTRFVVDTDAPFGAKGYINLYGVATSM